MDLFRKPTKKRKEASSQATRKRATATSDDEIDSTTFVDVIKKRKRQNPMVQTTKKHDDSKKSSSESSDEDVAVAEHSFAATGTSGPSGPRDQGATATLDIDTEVSQDARSQFERVQQQLKEGVAKDGKVLYKGAALYGAKEAKDTVKGNAASGANRFGPVRAPQFLRQTVRWDFAPDICKDFKETGYCTFGDSCKFVHDRSDYKHGWEIDRDFEAGKYGADDNVDYEIHEEEDEFPEECYLCRNVFTDPIVTKCKHYFCEKCAMTAFRKSTKCPICNENTSGIMNIARDLISYIKKKAVREDEVKEDIEDEESDSKAECSHSHDQVKEEPLDDSADDYSRSEGDVKGEPLSDEPDEPVDIVMESVEGLDGGENEEDESLSDDSEDQT